MTLWTRARRALLKAATTIQMRFGTGTRFFGPFLGRTRYNYARDVGDGLGNSLIVAVALWIARTFPEAPVQVLRTARDGSKEPVPEHPMLALIDRPNPFYSGILLWMATIIDWAIQGNAYWLKIPNGQGRPVQLWWIPACLIEPCWPRDGSVFISHYEYRPGGEPLKLPVESVVHFRYGLDPRNPRKGLAPLGALLREIFTDDEAANFSASLLRNLGIPGIIIAPDADDVTVSKDDAEMIKAQFAQDFGADNRGKPMVLAAKLKVTQLAFNPQQMDLRNLRAIPEERVSAVMGVPAAVVGFGAGLAQTKVGATMAEMREIAFENCIIPAQRLFSAELDTQLLPDFGATSGLRTSFDVSGVRVLQEDQNKLWARVDTAVRGGWLTVAAAKNVVGQPVDDGDEVYLRAANILAITPGQPPPALPPGPPAKALLPSGRKDAVDPIHAVLDRLKAQHAAALATDLESAFVKLARDVLATIDDRSKSRKAAQPEDAPIPSDWPEILVRILADESLVSLLVPPDLGKTLFQPIYDEHATLIAESTFGAVSERLGITVAWNLDDPVAQALIAAGGERITELDAEGQTRAAIMAALRDGRKAGDGAAALAKRIRGYVEGRAMYPGVYADAYKRAIDRGLGPEAAELAADRAARQYRAETIARAETAIGVNKSAVAAYQASGVVDGVTVFDGTDWDDGCRAANGQVWSFEQASANPIGHPRCVRSFSPHVRGS